MIALSLLFYLRPSFAEEPLSLEDIRPEKTSALPNFRKYRRVEGPYYFVGYGQQFTPLSGRSVLSVSHQLKRVNQQDSFEIGIRYSEKDPHEGIQFEDRDSMYQNEGGEFVQNTFLGGVDAFYVNHMYQPTTQWSLQSYVGTGLFISRHVYYLSNEEGTLFEALRWKGFSSTLSHKTRFPEIPLSLGFGGQTKVYDTYGVRLRYLHSLTYKRTPEEFLNVVPESRKVYQYSMLVLDIFYAHEED
jgi:hypothetical protein